MSSNVSGKQPQISNDQWKYIENGGSVNISPKHKGQGMVSALNEFYQENSSVFVDKNGDGLTKAESDNLYNKLVEIHQKRGDNRDINKVSMNEHLYYTKEELTELAEAAGYRVKTDDEIAQDEKEHNRVLREIAKHTNAIIAPDDEDETPSPAAKTDVKPKNEVTTPTPSAKPESAGAPATTAKDNKPAATSAGGNLYVDGGGITADNLTDAQIQNITPESLAKGAGMSVEDYAAKLGYTDADKFRQEVSDAVQNKDKTKLARFIGDNNVIKKYGNNLPTNQSKPDAVTDNQPEAKPAGGNLYTESAAKVFAGMSDADIQKITADSLAKETGKSVAEIAQQLGKTEADFRAEVDNAVKNKDRNALAQISGEIDAASKYADNPTAEKTDATPEAATPVGNLYVEGAKITVDKLSDEALQKLTPQVLAQSTGMTIPELAAKLRTSEADFNAEINNAVKNNDREALGRILGDINVAANYGKDMPTIGKPNIETPPATVVTKPDTPEVQPEAPKAEEPKAETPKTEAPKQEAPKTQDEPKTLANLYKDVDASTMTMAQFRATCKQIENSEEYKKLSMGSPERTAFDNWVRESLNKISAPTTEPIAKAGVETDSDSELISRDRTNVTELPKAFLKRKNLSVKQYDNLPEAKKAALRAEYAKISAEEPEAPQPAPTTAQTPEAPTQTQAQAPESIKDHINKLSEAQQKNIMIQLSVLTPEQFAQQYAGASSAEEFAKYTGIPIDNLANVLQHMDKETLVELLGATERFQNRNKTQSTVTNAAAEPPKTSQTPTSVAADDAEPTQQQPPVSVKTEDLKPKTTAQPQVASVKDVKSISTPAATITETPKPAAETPTQVKDEAPAAAPAAAQTVTPAPKTEAPAPAVTKPVTEAPAAKAAPKAEVKADASPDDIAKFINGRDDFKDLDFYSKQRILLSELDALKKNPNADPAEIDKYQKAIAYNTPWVQHYQAFEGNDVYPARPEYYERTTDDGRKVAVKMDPNNSSVEEGTYGVKFVKDKDGTYMITPDWNKKLK